MYLSNSPGVGNCSLSHLLYPTWARERMLTSRNIIWYLWCSVCTTNSDLQVLWLWHRCQVFIRSLRSSAELFPNGSQQAHQASSSIKPFFFPFRHIFGSVVTLFPWMLESISLNARFFFLQFSLFTSKGLSMTSTLLSIVHLNILESLKCQLVFLPARIAI